MHRNTYFYRVNKIAEMFFIDLKNDDDRLAVAFFTHFLSGVGHDLLFDVSQMPLSWQRAVGRAL